MILADTEWQLVPDEGHQNDQLISISEQILQLTQTNHEPSVEHARASTGS